MRRLIVIGVIATVAILAAGCNWTTTRQRSNYAAKYLRAS